MINVVGAVMVQGDKVFIFKRADSLRSMPGFFEFPGGKVEQYEMFKYALQRELSEELKINVDINNIHEFPNNVFKNEKLFLKLYIIVIIAFFKIKIQLQFFPLSLNLEQ